jgi:hypothetical protein
MTIGGRFPITSYGWNHRACHAVRERPDRRFVGRMRQKSVDEVNFHIDKITVEDIERFKIGSRQGTAHQVCSSWRPSMDWTATPSIYE